MTPADLPPALAPFHAAVEKSLADYLDRAWPASPESCIASPPGPLLADAVRHSLLGGGKRLRPVLALASASVFSDQWLQAMPAALAVEMIHTYSLIHDDLPSMDNDDLRRGRPTCHKAFGEAMAILAGDALLTQAFACMADTALSSRFAEAVPHWTRLLSLAAGPGGMVGGQALDLALEKRSAVALSDLETLHGAKTGAMITVSCRIGAEIGFLAERDGTAGYVETAPPVLQVEQYARSLGLAFQIADDLLDATGTSDALGKTAGKDARSGKATYVTVLGESEARRRAGMEITRALDSLSSFGSRAEPLRHLAGYVLDRQR